MEIDVLRIYDIEGKLPKNSVLVDRLWPRGVAKEKLAGAMWLKEVTPSNELRKWFHEDKKARWNEFSKRYNTELKQNKAKIKALVSHMSKGITLLTGVKDIERSHIPTLKKFLENL